MTSFLSVSRQLQQPIIYIGAEPIFSSDTRKVTETLRKKNLLIQEVNPSAAAYFFLFITDSFLKSKDRLFPLLALFVNDSHFKQRLFPIIMGKISIFVIGEELKYEEYWNNQLDTVDVKSAEYKELKVLKENIAPFIRAIRDTLMPSLDDLLQNNLASIVDAIKKRVHLIATKQFFFLPKESLSPFIGREKILSQLPMLFAEKSTIYLSGGKGVGKTVLALNYGKRAQGYLFGVFWFDGSNEESLRKSFQQLAAQLGLSSDTIIRELAQIRNFLLIFDNVLDVSLVPSIPTARTLIIGINLPNPDIVLENFSPEETLFYLEQQFSASAHEAKVLGDLLENNPARLAASVAYIKNTKISLQSYIDYYLQNSKELQDKQDKLFRSAENCSVRHRRALHFELDSCMHILEKYQTLTVQELAQKIKSQEIEIFLSYCWTPSKDSADQIDTTFKILELTLLRDERELRDFASIREFMKKVIREADYTLTLINDNYLKSFNCIFELITMMKDPQWMKRIFPIVLEGTNLDDMAISFYEEYWTKEAEKLEKIYGDQSFEVAVAQDATRKIGLYLRFVKEVEPESIETQVQTKFQGVVALMLARQETLEKKGLYRQEMFHLPMGRNKDFTGRDAEMAFIKDKLEQGFYSAITNTGMGGVGKSQLALEYAYRHEKAYSMIYWIYSEDMQTLKVNYRLMGQEMGIAEDFLKDNNVISTMKRVLENRQGWLLIFDNAEDPQILAEALPQKGGHILITSRNPNWESQLSLNVFSSKEALAYLQKISGISGQEGELLNLAEELGYLPLALTQAGAYIKRQNIDAATYLTVYRESQKQFLSQKERGYPDSVATTWLMSMERIIQEDPNAIMLLNFCSYLAPDNIPEKILEEWLKKTTNQSLGLDFQDALRVLESYSMINQHIIQKKEIYKKTISIHRLIQTVNREKQEWVNISSSLYLGLKVFNCQFEPSVDTPEERENAEVLVQHAQVFASHLENLGIVDEETESLLNKIGIFFYKMSYLSQAKEYYEKGLKIKIFCCGGENDPSVGSRYDQLGLVLKEQYDLEGAQKLCEKALEIYMGFYGNENQINVGICYNSLGNILLEQGDLKQAQKYYEKSLTIVIACYGGESNFSVAASYNNLGLIFKAQDNLSKAREYQEKALKIAIACNGGENHVQVAASYNNLGEILRNQGDFKKAQEYYEKSLKIKIACYGRENHPDVSISYNNLWLALDGQGDHKKAQEYHEKALKIRIACFDGENNLKLVENYKDLGGMLLNQSEHKQAQDCYEKALEISLVCFSGENYLEAGLEVGECYERLARILWMQGNLERAKECFEKQLKILISCHNGENNLFVAGNYNSLGLILRAQGDLKEAKKYCEKSLKITSAYYGRENDLLATISVAMCYHRLGEVIMVQGDLKEAKTTYEKALQIMINGQEDHNHLCFLPIYNSLGQVLKAQGDLMRAKEYYDKVLKIKIAFYGENHSEVAESYHNLELVLEAQGNLEKARECYKAAQKIKDALKS